MYNFSCFIKFSTSDCNKTTLAAKSEFYFEGGAAVTSLPDAGITNSSVFFYFNSSISAFAFFK
jgi:hypothetical protein